MTSFFLFYFFFFLTSAALVALARYLHPATFSSLTLTALLTAALTAAVIYLWPHE